jgi:hypothetical protein
MHTFNVFDSSDCEGYQALLRNEPKLDYWEGED